MRALLGLPEHIFPSGRMILSVSGFGAPCGSGEGAATPPTPRV